MANRDGRSGISPFESLPEGLDYGKIGERLLAMQTEADVDLSVYEYGFTLLYDGETQSLRMEKPYHGENKEQIKMLKPDQVVHGKYSVTGLNHTHTTRNPFSGGDIAVFLSEPLLNSSGLLMRDGRLAVLLRSHETVSIQPADIEQLRLKWRGQMQERLNQHPVSTEAEFRAQSNRVLLAMGRTLANKYQFGYYIGSEPNSTQLQRVA